jgi:antirestriction protein ArdC
VVQAEERLAGKRWLPASNGQPYKDINVLMLWGEALAKGHTSPIWMTYRQAAEYGGQVRKGEHGSLAVYADHIRKTDNDDNDDEIERTIPFLKGYTVFNAEQIDGLPEHFYAAPSPTLHASARINGAERFAKNTGIDIRHGGNRAFYAIDADHVRLPPFESFTDAESYYATLLHELVHNAARHPSRLAREFGRKRGACPGPRAGGDEGYAAEELVAELGAAFLCADLAMTPEPRADHAAYIASWLDLLKKRQARHLTLGHFVARRRFPSRVAEARRPGLNLSAGRPMRHIIGSPFLACLSAAFGIPAGRGVAPGTPARAPPFVRPAAGGSSCRARPRP